MKLLELSEEPQHDAAMEARVAVLEHIAASTKASIDSLRTDMRLRNDRIHRLQGSAERDFRILFASLITLAVGLSTLMAKGFHWF